MVSYVAATQPPIIQHASLRHLNTFAVPAKAQSLMILTHPNHWEVALEQLVVRQQSMPLILGSGSNVLFVDDYPNWVMHNNTRGITVVEEDAEHVWVDVVSGENWHDFVRYSLLHGWYGLENLSLIPGTIGAAPVQNIGAYGLEVGERIHSVNTWDVQTQQQICLTAEQCAFAYRDSLFKQSIRYINGLPQARYWITSVCFKLSKRAHITLNYRDLAHVLRHVAEPTPLQVSDAVIEMRQTKLPDPERLGNAGSFFKNPLVSVKQAQALLCIIPDLVQYPVLDQVKLAAAQLIDKAGFKGKCIGKVSMYERQALVMVNHGGATGRALYEYALLVQKSVYDLTGVMLEPEPLIVPQP